MWGQTEHIRILTRDRDQLRQTIEELCSALRLRSRQRAGSETLLPYSFNYELGIIERALTVSRENEEEIKQ